ncbi:uncharacterized protein L201_003299 [Kwoniella dendrophila CBS 6074]|uniref:Glutamyl-tRNA(Gln) amidotransferase subunit F, mitochondrial n=1 Tax=Kwoniella dendrophila CBS 6074 TaxID=1295534 RepID=A0AAX4JU94_9TREE
MSMITSQARLVVLRTVLQNQSRTVLNLSSSYQTQKSIKDVRNFTSSCRQALDETSCQQRRSSSPTNTVISRTELHKLHRLSALNPPEVNSLEEKELIEELSELIDLMNQVKGVNLPSSLEERSKLLSKGINEVILNENTINGISNKAQTHRDIRGDNEVIEKSGKELLSWSNNKLGDYYVSKIKKKE